MPECVLEPQPSEQIPKPIQDEVSEAVANFEKHLELIPSPIKKVELSTLTVDQEWCAPPRPSTGQEPFQVLESNSGVTGRLGPSEISGTDVKRQVERGLAKDKLDELEKNILRTNEVKIILRMFNCWRNWSMELRGS